MNKTNLDLKAGQRGITLLEVLIALGIIAIMSVLAIGALFYPRYLVATSNLEQSAIHAGTAELERHLHNFLNPVARGTFDTDGWPMNIQANPPVIITESVPNGDPGDTSEYIRIAVTNTYRDGKSVVLTTYRCLKYTSDR